MKDWKNISFLGELTDKPIRKTVAFLMLIVFNTNIFSTVTDPVGINNARMTRTTTGIEQLDIATPNANGTSYNSLRELQVSEQGLIINNNPNVVADTEIAGLIVRNRNLDNGIAANLIITEVTGKNRTNINGYVEIAGKRADLVMANRNGITVNGGGFLNADRVTLTTGNLYMENGNLIAIDVAQNDITVGEKGIDALSLSDLELISKTINIDGIIKASNETKILISSGGQTYQYRTKEIKSKGETYRGIAVDAKNQGSMYAGKIDILSNDKGAGVNVKGDLVSVDDITITASGNITTNKVATNKTVRYNTNKKVKLNGEIKAGRKVVVKSNETEINAKVITGFLEENLGKSAFEADSDKITVSGSGNIESYGKINIKSRLTENRGEIYSTEKVEVTGQKLDNTEGIIRSNGNIKLDVSETKNVKGYILSDGLTKEEADNWAKAKIDEKIKDNNTTDTDNANDNNNHGINIIGDRLENTEGIIASLTNTELNLEKVSNEKGSIVSKGIVELIIYGDYVHEGLIEGDTYTKIKGNTIVVNDNIRRNSILELIGNNNLILRENIVAKVLKLETGKNLENEKEIKGTEALILTGDNILNKGNILSDDYLELIAKNKLINEGTGTIEGLGNTYLKAGSIYNSGNILSNTDVVLISDMLIRNNTGAIKSENVYAEIKNGALENINGGIIEAGKDLKIKADNIYNTQSYTQDGTGQNTVLSGMGGKIIGENVYLEALERVINGTEEYTDGIYRREDGVLIDSRQVNSMNKPFIAGNDSTVIKAGSLINTSDIGVPGTGQTYIETINTAVNASIGDSIAKINGNEVYIKSKAGLNNVGGQIEGSDRTQVISEAGKILNESTVLRNEDMGLLTESIRNIGKIGSNGIVYLQGKNVENVAGNIQGEQGTYLKADNDVEDRTIILKYKGNNITESGINWNELERNITVSGILGLGGDTLIEAGNDIILESSDLRASDDIVLDARNYILMLSTVDTEYKYRTETHKKGGGLRRKKVTTNTWIEDNAYVNGVDITSNGNILMNYRGDGTRVDNKGVFAQGVNFNAGGQIYGLSDGNIYIQGTKDSLNSIFNSQTTKSFLGVKYSKKNDYINENREKYKLSQLYGNAGITIDAEGKLKVEGSDISSKGNIFLSGKLGTDILPGTEAYRRYEEHKSIGFNGSLMGLLSGIEKTSIEKSKTEIINDKITNVGTRINSSEGKVEISGDTVYIQGGKIGAKGEIILDGRKGIVIADALNYEKNEYNIEKHKIGVSGISGNIDTKNLGASIGINSTYTLNDNSQSYLYPERSILVSDRDIYIKSNDGNIHFQGEAGAKGNIVMIAENGTIYIKDSESKINVNNKAINGNVFFGLAGNIGGIKNTFKSYKDYINSIKALRDTGKVLRLIKDIVKGEDIYETLEGREDAVNALNTYFKGPSSGGVSGGVSVIVDLDQAKNVGEYVKNLTTNIRTGENIVLRANNLDFYGGNVESVKNTILEAKNININASEDKYTDTLENIGFSGHYIIYGTRGGGASVSYQKGKGEGTIHNNTQITAGDTLYVRSDNMNIKGGNLRAGITDVKTKNLVLESIQDIEKYREIGSGISVSISKGGKNSKGKGEGSGSISGVKQTKEWVGNQSSITGSKQLILSAESAYIKGGLIANIDENGDDKGNLNVNVSKLTLEDIQNEDKKVSVGVRAGFSQRNKVPTYDQIYIKDTNGKYIATGAKTGVSFGMSLGGFDKEKITRATIGSGVLTTDRINGDLNRDITKADEIIKDINVSAINVDYSNTNRKWGQIGEIMADHAGTIGAVVDDLSQQVFGIESKNYNEKWAGTVYIGYRKLEDFIDKKLYNDKVPIIPTSGQHGGVLEGIEKFFTKDKFPIYNLTLKVENGKTIITGNKVNNGSQITNTEIFLNGMTEESERSIENAINQLISRHEDTRDKLNNGETVNITLIYSPTRGNWVDGLESVLGKLFDGSGLAGVTLGTSRGLADILMQLDPDKHYNITSYSQGNIVMQGALNYLKNNGIKLREEKDKNSIVLYHTGSPKASKIFDDLESSVGFTNGVSMINRLDAIGSDEGVIAGTKGLISETRDYNVNESSWTVWKKYFEWVPVLRSALPQESYPVLDTPKVEEFTGYYNQDGLKIRDGRYEAYREEIMLANNLKNAEEFKEFVENYHRWYNIDDRTSVRQILGFIEGYETATEEQKAALESIVNRIRKDRMDSLVNGWRQGFPVSTEDIKDFRTAQLYEEYKNNKGGEWQENYGVIQVPNINREIAVYRYNEKMAEGLEDYIERLKNEVK